MNLSKAKQYYQLANYQANLFSKDPNTKVAAILLAQDSLQILSTGFNGICRGLKETDERWTRPLKYKWVCHAEMNAIANAARGGVKVENAICVVTMFPCVDCCKALIQSGISVVVSEKPDMTNERWGQDFDISMTMIQESGIQLIFVDTD
jgi:dCMP deaminase